jgi:hypothetical protein
MNAATNYPRGLTRLIFEALVSVTPQLAAEGETLTPELLQRVEQAVHQQLAPEGSDRDRLIFDMVFSRSFSEAQNLILHQEARPARALRSVQAVPLQASA